jgi:hypothetical protein
MDSLRIRIYGAFLYDFGVYSCLSSRLVVGPVKVLLTSGGAWDDNDEVRRESLESWVVLPELVYLIMRDGSEMDATECDIF